MKSTSERRGFLKELIGDDLGAVLVITTVYLPVIVGFFSLAVDMAYIFSVRNTLQVTAESAALGAVVNANNASTACTVAKQYATKNMDPSKYGNVLKQNTTDCSDVVMGTWQTTNNCPDTTTGTNKFCKMPVGQDCATFHCNAVRVNTRTSSNNGNTLSLFFAPLIGWTGINVSATAIATYGTNPFPWDMTVVQDISASFTRPQYTPQTAADCEAHHSSCSDVGVLPQARLANQALLGCLNATAPVGSRMGITTFTGSAHSYQTPLATGDGSLPSKINNLPQCGFISDSGSTPKCSTGTDIAAGINGTITGYSSNPNSNPNAGKTIVIITDGLPTSYHGSYCGGDSGCLNSAKRDAVDSADDADAAGITVSTIYYCSSGNCDANAQSWLASLVRKKGVALVTPDLNNLTNVMGQLCASQPHRLVW